MDVPGVRPMLPLTTVGPVLVMVEKPRTLNACAPPREICALAGPAASNSKAALKAARMKRD